MERVEGSRGNGGAAIKYVGMEPGTSAELRNGDIRGYGIRESDLRQSRRGSMLTDRRSVPGSGAGRGMVLEATTVTVPVVYRAVVSKVTRGSVVIDENL